MIGKGELVDGLYLFKTTHPPVDTSPICQFSDSSFAVLASAVDSWFAY